MTSPDERHEVAERLRFAAKTESCSPDYLWNRLEIAVNGWRFGDVIDESYVSYNGVLARLADLIDPQERTCHPISSHEAFPNMDWKWFSEQLTKNHAFGTFRFCSVCHSPLGQSDMLDSFCSRCGARVVSE